MASLDNKTAWQPVLNCDNTFDGVFLYAVKTTQIYCLPSCKSKTQLQQNVAFYNDSDEAEQAGFRACKKCRPNDALHKK